LVLHTRVNPRGGHAATCSPVCLRDRSCALPRALGGPCVRHMVVPQVPHAAVGSDRLRRRCCGPRQFRIACNLESSATVNRLTGQSVASL
jgi:hypothetical protein